MEFKRIAELIIESEKKILLLVMDGLGGLPMKAGGPTELEAANTPHMDALAKNAACGLMTPIAPGVTPGSGPAHLALFGYDPLRYEIGRGVLEALGIGFELRDEDLAVRGNFCTVDRDGIVTDRRAGRISTETCTALCARLRDIRLPDAVQKKFADLEVFVEPVKEHRFVLVFRAASLGEGILDTDPGRTGQKPLPVRTVSGSPSETAELIEAWIAEAGKMLSKESRANMVMLRGIAKDPGLPSFREVYGLKAGAIAAYPMYRGVAKLAGMEVLKTGDTIADEIRTLKENRARFDFIFLHVKKTDTYGEDGNFAAKVRVIEEVDACLPEILDGGPDVLVVTGDHSTPALLKSHSWHPVPVMIHSPHASVQGSQSFCEKACAQGYLGHFPARHLMLLAMANALRFTKYGA
jgi:2,3-bisphosphoglycerate-independent phosphoglycerate mutase